MASTPTIFFDFNLPNAATWFYFSLLLTIALYFRFDRLLCIRNWDIVALFALVPGFLLLQEAGEMRLHPVVADPREAKRIVDQRELAAFVVLIGGSLYFFVRCIIDLALVRRPQLSPNLNFAGMAWLATALIVCLTAVAFRQPAVQEEKLGNEPVVVKGIQSETANIVSAQAPLANGQDKEVRYVVERILAITAHFAIVVLLFTIGVVHFQDRDLGMAAACFYLLIPYTAFHVTQIHHVWPTIFVLAAVLSYRIPTLAGVMLGIAAGTTTVPILLLPVWAGFYRGGRGLGRFLLAAFCTTGLVVLSLLAIYWYNGMVANSLQQLVRISDWHPWHPPGQQGIWGGIHWAYRVPVFTAFVAFTLLTYLWPTPKNLGQVIALSAAILIGVQFWYGDRGGVYVLWYLPLLLLMTFRPNLNDREAVRINPDTDAMLRLRRKLVGRTRRLIGRNPAELASAA
jgi:hypothetical protein